MHRRLSAALSPLLPTAEQTLLLRACLHEREGTAAWTALGRRLGPDGLGPLLTGNRRLLPLLHRAATVDPGGFGLDADLQRRLAAVALREKLRSTAFRRGAHEVVGLLAQGGHDVLVLRGAALAELAYPDPYLRHCHDLDLLTRGAGVTDAGLAGRAMLHPSAFSHPRAQADDRPLWDRSLALALGGHPARVMSPADLLVHVCGHAYLSGSRASLAWATDAWFTLAAWPDLDWDLVLATADERHLGLGLGLLLGYAGEQLGAPVPAVVLDALRRSRVEP
ncbi:MAG TPA: nucleotidyltransferase family protein, partial [Acidimicrobiales bacterium]|nr:nucleotidyltransferase family protein [Acidimicrobiales bacterium]